MALVGNQLIAIEFPWPARLPEVFHFQFETLAIDDDIALRIKKIDHDWPQQGIVTGIIDFEFGKKKLTIQEKTPSIDHSMRFGTNQSFPNNEAYSLWTMRYFQLIFKNTFRPDISFHSNYSLKVSASYEKKSLLQHLPDKAIRNICLFRKKVQYQEKYDQQIWTFKPSIGKIYYLK